MSDSERLLGWFADGLLRRPGTEGPTLVDVARAVARLCGAGDISDDPGVARMAERIGPAEHYVFVLVDGLGLNLIDRLPAEAFLRRQPALRLQTVFPSTTAAALTSLATGEWPGCHAVPGWWTYLPNHSLTATILPFVERYSERPLAELGVSIAEAFPVAPLAARFGRRARAFMPRSIAHSVYSTYARNGIPTTPYALFSEGVEGVLQMVRGTAPPTYSSLYTAVVDAAAHRGGLASEGLRGALDLVDRELARLAAGLSRDARLIVTADHGMIDVPESAKAILEPDDPLLASLIVPPTGEARVPMFHVRPGQHEAFAARFRDRFGDRFALLSIAEVEALGLFGPGALSPIARGRIGDFLALSAGPDILLYLGAGPRGAETLRGYHAGLTAAEMEIPLILA